MAGWITTSISRLADQLRSTVELTTGGTGTDTASSRPSSSQVTSKVSAITDDLRSLERTCGYIEAALEDAEKMEIQNKSVKVWLAELKDECLDAEDLLGDCEYELRQIEVEAEDNKVFSFPIPSPSLLSFEEILDRIEGRVRGISERLDEIRKRKEQFVLRSTDSKKEPRSEEEAIPEREDPRASLPSTTTHVYGRDRDKKKLIQMLLSTDDDDDDVSVISLVGVGGVGKTTLAELVYSSDEIGAAFGTKMWVSVSDEFDAVKITRAAIESESKMRCDLTELSSLQEELRGRLQRKRFLLVLDDVWNERFALWDSLGFLLQMGRRGSKVLVTTRIEEVARTMSSARIYNLKPLSNRDCWDLFERCAFFMTGQIDPAAPELVAVGKEIAKKCKGSPLVAKVVAGLLLNERDVRRWEEVLNSETWQIKDEHGNNDILEVLKLSYINLPIHLKQCFLYCSAYPKDYEFEKHELVRLWIAQGLIRTRNENWLEGVGLNCLAGLLRKSFLQIVRASTYRGLDAFVVHDIMHDLAQYILKDQYSVLPRGDHVHQTTKDHGRYEPRMGGTCRELDNYQSIPVHRVRVLDLTIRTDRETDRAFQMVENMTRLRYLRLRKEFIKKPPDSLCKLYNLQTLDLRGVTKLPQGITRLICLRHLLVGDKFMSLMISIPTGIGKLTNLQTLNHFDVRREGNYCTIAELKHLRFLRGHINIRGLENVVTAGEAMEAQLDNKAHLEAIFLTWYLDGSKLKVRDDEILEYLKPNVHLATLSINGYGGSTIPSWLGDQSFSRLTNVEIYTCTRWNALPGLGQLPCLRSLDIQDMPLVRTVGLEFYGSTCSHGVSFSNLENLTFYSMNNWEEWHVVNECKFPRLQRLWLINCPRLKVPPVLENPPPSLRYIKFNGSDILQEYWRTSQASRNALAGANIGSGNV